MTMFRNSDEILLSMSKIPIDDALESLNKLRIREHRMKLCDLGILKRNRFVYHRLKTMVKRSIEQNLRMKNFGIRNGNYERNAEVKNPGDKTVWTKSSWRFFGHGKLTGKVLEEIMVVSDTISISVQKWHNQIRLRILSCRRVSENHREPEVPEEEVPAGKRLDGLAGITQKKLATTHFVKGDTLQNACSARQRVVVGLGQSTQTHTVRLTTGTCCQL